MVSRYNNLLLERDRQLQTSRESNPIVQDLNLQIETMRKDLLTNLENIKQGLIVERNALVKKSNETLGQIRTSPSKERAFLDISRQQEVKQQLYLYLLQKREETAISKSGTLANSRLIEPAMSESKPFAPKKSLLYLCGFISGLADSCCVYLFQRFIK